MVRDRLGYRLIARHWLTTCNALTWDPLGHQLTAGRWWEAYDALV